jgi:DNA-binding transcriptional ArsR family regulator
MRTSAPLLLPIFRSRSQADLLTEMYLHEDREYSLADLARAVDVSMPTVYREVGQLMSAGLLRDRRVGNVRQVSANTDSPLFAALRQLLDRAFGPVERLRSGLIEVKGVQGAWLFGSYAERFAGVAGEVPRDVDVAVVMDAEPWDVYQICSQVGSDLHLEVNATIFSTREWSDPDNVFVRQIRSRPLVDLLGDDTPTCTVETS